ncbi:unnamed protein product [Merluccius merluccius]
MGSRVASRQRAGEGDTGAPLMCITMQRRRRRLPPQDCGDGGVWWCLVPVLVLDPVPILVLTRFLVLVLNLEHMARAAAGGQTLLPEEDQAAGAGVSGARVMSFSSNRRGSEAGPDLRRVTLSSPSERRVPPAPAPPTPVWVTPIKVTAGADSRS